MSFATLKEARLFVLKHLLHALPLRDTHLRSILMAAVDVELGELSESECSCLKLLYSKLLSQSRPANVVADRSLIKDLTMEDGNCVNGCFRKHIVEELMDRKYKVSCIKSAETALNVVSHAIRHNSNDVEIFTAKVQNKHGRSPV